MYTKLALAVVLVISTFATKQSNARNNEWLSYYPATKDVDSFFQGHFSQNNGWTLAHYNIRYLHLMGEKPLLDTLNLSVPQVFRLLIITRPQSLPVVVRLLIRTDGSGEAVTKVSQSSRNSEPLAVNRTEEVSGKQVNQLLGLVAASDFWSLPLMPPLDLSRVPMGEADWMLEAEKNGAYHVVCRTTANLGSLRNPMMFLLIDAGKLDLASVEDDRALSK